VKQAQKTKARAIRRGLFGTQRMTGSAVLLVLYFRTDALGHSFQVLHGFTDTRSRSFVTFFVELVEVVLESFHKAFEISESAHCRSSKIECVLGEGKPPPLWLRPKYGHAYPLSRKKPYF
jgi:hypothetical protein